MKVHAQALDAKSLPSELIRVVAIDVKPVEHAEKKGKKGERDQQAYVSYLFLGTAMRCDENGEPIKTEQWPGCWAHSLLVSALEGLGIALTDVKTATFALIPEGERKGRTVFSLDLREVNGESY